MNSKGLFCLSVLLGVLGFSTGVNAQNIKAIVNPNGSVDIRNNSGGNWYFYKAPRPARAEMFRVDSSGITVSIWGTPGVFAPDTNKVSNRIYSGEYLRVLATNVGPGTNIVIPFSYKPSGSKYYFVVKVVKSHKVLSITLLDPTPTAASVVHWKVTFDTSISGVTVTNFAFASPDGMHGMVITNISGSGNTRTVTATTGVGCGLLGLNWAGHVAEIPLVPTLFTGALYDFSTLPVITQNPQSGSLVTGQTTNLTVAARSHCGSPLTNQWYSGSSVQPQSATPIPGATGNNYVPPPFSTAGTNNFFARVYNGADYSDTGTATITVIAPPAITQQPAGQMIATGETASFSVAADGTALGYQWFQGLPGSAGKSVGSNSPVLITPPLSTNSPFWVRVTNLLGSSYCATSAVAYATVATRLAPSVTNHVTVVGKSFANPISATLLDSAGNPMPNQRVTFTAPASGPSGTFPGSVKTTSAVTQPSGRAEIVAFTANAAPGSFNLQANFHTLTSSIPMLNLSANPVLNITNRLKNIGVSWPADATGYVLQSTTNLASGNWTDMPITARTNSAAFSRTNAASQRFYRLRFNSGSP